MSRILILMVALAGACKSQPHDADNTGQNSVKTPTADNAVTAKGDLDITQRIRKAVMDDSSLSSNAHNCKIVVQNGTVTLTGPVASADERTKVDQLAATVVGDHNVVDQLAVSN